VYGLIVVGVIFRPCLRVVILNAGVVSMVGLITALAYEHVWTFNLGWGCEISTWCFKFSFEVVRVD